MVSNKEAIGEIAKNVFYATRIFCEGVLFIPTTIRRIANAASFETLDELLPAVTIPICSLYLGLYVYGYHKLFEYDSDVGFWMLGTQIATNVCSGSYEYFRHTKLRMEKKMKAKNPSGLEKTVAEQEQKIEIQPIETNFIDPWKVKIPKND